MKCLRTCLLICVLGSQCVAAFALYAVRICDLTRSPVPPNPVRVWGRVTSLSPVKISDGTTEIPVTGLDAFLNDFVVVTGNWSGSVLSVSSSRAVTIFCASDVHFTGTGCPVSDKTAIQAMNGMAGTVMYPTQVGTGYVAAPWAVLLCGDLCDGGTLFSPASDSLGAARSYPDQWSGFDYYFPRDGVSGDNNRLKYRNYAVSGNHDYWRVYGTFGGTSSYVTDHLKTRYGVTCNSTNGNIYYSFDQSGVHFVALGRYPDSYVRSWLATDLASVGTTARVVLFLHYAFNEGSTWWSDADRQALYNVIAGYNVVAILNGHTHESCHFTWNGYDVFDDGETAAGEFGVLSITDYRLRYAHYKTTADGSGNWTGGSWDWCFTKPLY